MSTATVLAGTQQWHVECADVREGLARLPDNSVHVCVTSPPYHGLRAYGTAPQVWGGVDCDHVWGDEIPGDPKGGSGTPNGRNRTNGHSEEHYARGNPSGAYCQRCSAWRGELGSEPDPMLFVAHLVEIFREVRRVLRPDGTCWINIGDSYAGSGKGPNTGNSLAKGKGDIKTAQERQGFVNQRSISTGSLKAKDLCLVPERLAIALQDDGWWVRSRIAWCKTSAMPEAVTDRPTSAWEHIWLLSKSRVYFYDADVVRQPFTAGTTERYEQGYNASWKRAQIAAPRDLRTEGFIGTPEALSRHGGANLRNYWVLGPEPYADAHFATFPGAIPERAILAGTSAHGVCSACGAPYKRVVKRTAMVVRPGPGRDGARAAAGGASGSRTAVTGTMTSPPLSETIGWQTTCTCQPSTVIPAVVLDPFCGSGTTLIEALRHGRRAIGLELQPKYVELARRRIVRDAPLFNAEPL